MTRMLATLYNFVTRLTHEYNAIDITEEFQCAVVSVPGRYKLVLLSARCQNVTAASSKKEIDK